MFFKPDGFNREELSRTCFSMSCIFLALSFLAVVFQIPPYGISVTAILFAFTGAFLRAVDD